jgi:hypothetical protein
MAVLVVSVVFEPVCVLLDEQEPTQALAGLLEPPAAPPVP